MITRSPICLQIFLSLKYACMSVITRHVRFYFLACCRFSPRNRAETQPGLKKNGCNNPVSQLAPYFFIINKNKDSIGITTCMQATL